MQRRLAQLIATLTFGALGLGASACVIRESPGVNRGYGYGYASAGYHGGVQVGTPSPYYVSSLPPEPLYETMSTSPGYGYVWIDGNWHWNGYEWVWVSGRWTRDQSGYVYVQPWYDWGDDGRYVYYPGHWSRPERVPDRVRVIDHRDGRPSTGYHPPRPQTERPPVRDHRDGSGGGGHVSPRPPRDTDVGRPPRDHREPDNDRPTTRPPRDPRDTDVGRPPRDHREPDAKPPAPRPPRKPDVNDGPRDNAKPDAPRAPRPVRKPDVNGGPRDNAPPPRDSKPTTRPDRKPPKSDSKPSPRPRSESKPPAHPSGGTKRRDRR